MKEFSEEIKLSLQIKLSERKLVIPTKIITVLVRRIKKFILNLRKFSTKRKGKI